MLSVLPAKAGIQKEGGGLDSRLRWNDKVAIFEGIRLDMINKRLVFLPAQDMRAVGGKLKLALGVA